jgi:hypothetical protein
MTMIYVGSRNVSLPLALEEEEDIYADLDEFAEIDEHSV